MPWWVWVVGALLALYLYNEWAAHRGLSPPEELKKPQREEPVPEPGSWPADTDMSNGPPFFIYTEDGKRKVTRKGDDLYGTIVGSFGRRR